MPATALKRIFMIAVLALLAGCGKTQSPADGAGAHPDQGEAATSAKSAIPLGPLPDDVTPSSYTLDLKVNPAQERFSGRVRIDITIHHPLSRIFLHGKKLHVSRAELLDAAGASHTLIYQQVDPSGVAQVTLEAPLAAQKATLLLDYDAPLNRQLEGLYRVNVGKVAYAFTQFEATSARLAFPGFDEPRFKTPFTTSLTVPAGLTALANTHQTAVDELPNGGKRVHFATTLPLPTYLVAFAIGDFDIVAMDDIPPSAVRSNPVPLRGIAVKGQGHKLHQALAKTTGLLQTLENYFGIAYPYDKLDIVAVPDFAAGAMENAGLITYRDSLLLMDDNAPAWQHRASASVQAHEMAHQWFGDLVTMPWWDDTWLNEAFATWMGHWAVAHWKPEYHFDRDMLASSMGAFGADSLVSARQIRQPIKSYNDISSAFDGITYSKGGGVLAMFESFLGEENFRQAIRYHLNRFRFGNATVYDFMDSLASKLENGDAVREAFKSYLFQPGLPFVDVSPQCSQGKVMLKLRQSRYLPTGSSGAQTQRWDIPMCVRYGNGAHSAKECFLFSAATAEHVLATQQCPAWVMPNADGAGYYRWHLPAAPMKALREAGDALNAREQMSMADSLEAGFENGSVDAARFLQQFPALARSQVRYVATTPMSNWVWISRHLLPPEQMEAARNFARALYQNRVSDLALDQAARPTGQDMETTLLQNSLVGFLALDAHLPAVREAMRTKGLAYAGFHGDGKLHPEMIRSDWISTALQVAVETSGKDFVDALVQQFSHSRNGLVRRNLLGAIARVTDPALAEKIHALILDPALRSNEIVGLLAGHMRRPENRKADWQWLQANYAKLVEKLPTAHQRRLIFATGGFCSQQAASEVRAFFQSRVEALEGGPRALANILESIHLCAARVEQQRESAQRFFQSQ